MNKIDKQKASVLSTLRENAGRFIPPTFLAVHALNGKANKPDAASYALRALARDGVVEVNKDGWGKAI